MLATGKARHLRVLCDREVPSINLASLLQGQKCADNGIDNRVFIDLNAELVVTRVRTTLV